VTEPTPLDRMNPEIQLLVRDPQCELCKMHTQAQGKDVCVTASGPARADVMVVTKSPLSAKGRTEMLTYLERAGVDPAGVAFTAAIKCRAWDLDPGKGDLKACKPYLDREIEAIGPKFILALGNEAMYSLVGKSGIMKHRGVVYERGNARVLPTISPSMVYRNPGLKGGFEADLKYFDRMIRGVDNEDDFTFTTVSTLDDLRLFITALKQAEVMAFDIETNGYDEFAPDAAIVSLAVTLASNDPDAPMSVWAVPLMHPESPWRRHWHKVLVRLASYFNAVPKAIAHNGKFDCRWLRQFGVDRRLTFDTMLAAHTLDENRPKGLKPLAQQLLGVKPWAISTKDLVDTPLDEVLLYNAKDTFYTLGLYRIFKGQFGLPANKRKMRIFTKIMMPCSEIFTDVEREGVWTDTEKMMTHGSIAKRELAAIDAELLTFVPEDKGGHKEVNFNPSNFARWFIFEHLGLPVFARGKDKDDGSPGQPSMAEAIMLDLQDKHPHRALELLIERTKWQKYDSAFFSAYAEQVDENDRIHTTFKLTGTVTGRLSSGKPDTDKVTSRKQNRGVNLQQVPRDDFVRGIFGAPPGSSFVEADYSQVELRVAAFIARETTMLHLYATGQDIHTTMAMKMTGKPADRVTKDERKKAKAVNFGFLYGMGVNKFIETAWSNYGVRVTEQESKAFRDAFFTQFPMLLKWHARQRRLVSQYKRVESPLGRVRHLPDIDSPNQGVRSEAERQAINSPVQSFASDMALLSMVRITEEFKRQGMRAHPIGTVHDAINFEIPDEELSVALPIIKDNMENLPLRRMFGVNLDVPIIADLKVGTRWGGATEITPEQIYNWKGLAA
jgi:uracil-DNA glycosylase family 4